MAIHCKTIIKIKISEYLYIPLWVCDCFYIILYLNMQNIHHFLFTLLHFTPFPFRVMSKAEITYFDNIGVVTPDTTFKVKILSMWNFVPKGKKEVTSIELIVMDEQVIYMVYIYYYLLLIFYYLITSLFYL